MQSLYGLQYFISMSIWLDRVPNLTHNTIFVDQEGGTVDAHERFAKHVFLFVDIVELSHLGIGIGEQGKGETVLVRKFLVRGYIIHAHAKDHDPPFLHLVIGVA